MADEGAVTVCVRVRPLIAREKALEDKLSLHWKSENNTISEVNGTKVFSYDRVFHSSDSTQQLYEGVAVPIIQSAVQGYNGTIFAYGQTASGKTYTMMGNEDSAGIIPKAIQHIFKVICEIPDREFLLRVSYMEIYNETITDLLCDTRKKKPLGIREDVNRNIFVEDLIEEVVVAPEEVMEWIRKGERNRHYGETKMNEHSSRSHTIFRMIIESRERSDLANASCDGAVMVSHLNLVDLAGSERASQTGSEGVRLKEGCNINRSLFILGQVIKKLCDDPSGFINYRDSKLTRILQNSLGGNAKTVIICTITPVSLDETLSTLQFASTAKRMKNTPKVNEVLNDDALLKRYRKEILDLKKQLEEVSSKTQIHAMEKDQLAQLLEEKNSLQKVQEDRIRNLTRMLVTSASFSSKANAQAKKRRRVTWAPGKINQTNVRYFEETGKSRLSETKKMKTSLSSPTDMEDSIVENSECDSQSLVISDQIPETGWTAGPNMNWSDKYFEESVELCETLARERDMALNRVKVLQADYNHLVLENKQLNLEINEVREKLKEKTETDEFEALEKQTQKDYEVLAAKGLDHEISYGTQKSCEQAHTLKLPTQETIFQYLKAVHPLEALDIQVADELQQYRKVQLIHEITNLKNMVSNAEVYNEELEAEINSKLEELKEKENKIKVLQKQVEELQKARAEKKDTSFSVGSSDNLLEEIQQLNKSLLDSETIALDAKKEAAFLRSENLELKEKMNELSNNYNQMQKDVQLYQSQIEAGKASYRKMQADLQRELQAVFQENTRLTSLMEGKVPKDFLSLVELEKKAADLKGDLEKALKENAFLQNQVHELSQFQSLPNTVEMQQKEILEKCEELHLLKLEKEKLLSEVADSEIRLKEMTEEIGKAKDDLADAQLKYVKSDQEYLALKQLHEELEQKYISVSENNEQIKLQVDVLAQEAQEAKTALDEGKLELISRIKELEEETAEYKQQVLEVREEHIRTQQKLNELEQLEGQGKIMEMRLEAKDSEIQAVLQQLTECQEKMKTLTQERDDLKQKEESLQAEADQLKEDIKDTVSMNILAQEELRSAQSSLKQAQDTVKKLEKSISEKESQILSVEETLGKTIKELEIKLSQMTEEIKTIPSERDQLAEGKSENCRESNELQMQKEQILLLTQENNSLRDKLDSLCLEKEHGEGNLIPQIHKQSIEQELFLLREELNQTQRKLLEMEGMKANECQGEPEKMERTEPTLELPDCQEVSTQTERGDDNLITQLENLQNERDQLRETIQETTSKNSEMMEELRCAHNSLKQHQEAIVELKGSISAKENQLLEVQESLKNTTGELQQKLTELTENLTRVSSECGKLLAEKEQMERTMNEHISKQLENITVLQQEKDELQQVVETCKAERDQLEADCQDSKERSLKVLTEMEDLQGELTHQRKQAEMLKNMLANREESFQNTEDELNEVINKLKEKVVKLNEDLHLVTTEKHQLLELKEKNGSESSKLAQLEEQCDLLAQEREKLQDMLEGVQVEKNKLEINLQESVDKILETEKKLKHQQELLREEKIKAEEREECLSEVQRQSDVLKDSLTNKIQQLTEMLNSISCEKDQLLAERTSQSCQLQEQISSINQEKDELQKILQDVRSERDQLKTELQKRSEMCEIHSKLEGPLDQWKQRNLSHVSIQVNSLDNAEQVTDNSLKERTLNIEELLEKFLTMGKRCECLSTVSLKLKSDLESQKELIAVILPQLSSEESNQLKKLQMTNENINGHLQSLLNKVKFLFSHICSKRREYYATVNKHEMELLEEKRKQDELQAQIQYLRKTWMNQTGISSEEFNSSEVLQSLHLDAESLLKDVSEMESELLCIEAELHQQESSRRETLQFWEAVSRTECDAEELKEELKKDYERLLQGIKFWTPKSKTLYQLFLELDARIANYCKNANVESKQTKEITEKLLQELKTLKDQLAPDASASLALEEENCRLHNKLKAAEQDKKAMEVKIQKLENEINEVAKDVEKKNDRINKLEEQVTTRVSVSELTQLQAKLDETEKQLRTTLTVNQSLQAEIDKGTEGYKEEIDSLKTQLVKCDMARMKTFNTLDKKLADYKAVAEHQKQQIRKLQEDLRRAYQEKDSTVLLEKESPQQSQLPLTCGGGSGIVQSTHMLVLKSEQAKLQKENLHLKKQNDDLLCNKRELKEELVKWKVRALKWREQASRKNTREAVPRSPRKAVSYFLEEQVSTPPKEPISEETVIQDLPKPLPRACTNFFDNSSLGIPADTQFPGLEPLEEHLQRWFGTPEKDKAPDCTTQ